MGYSPWDRKESNTTEQLQFTFTLRSQELKITRLFCPQDFLGKNAGCCCCSVSKLCPILCDKVDCSIPGSSVLKFMFIESLMLCNQLILCRPLLLLPSILSSIKVFSNESALPIRWPKYWSFSFSISPSNEYPGLISFRIDWFNLLAVQGTLQESSPTPQLKSISFSTLCLLYGPALTSIHDYWKNHSFDYMDLCQQSNVSAF